MSALIDFLLQHCGGLGERISIVRGAPTNYTISITPSGGFSAPVTLTAGGFPPRDERIVRTEPCQ